MLTPCKSVESRQDDLLADEDMLENTKPNLISFSLSTSSSNYTVSATTNSCQRDVEVESSSGNQMTSFEHLRPSGKIKLPKMSLTSPVADSPATIASSCSESSAKEKLLTERTFSNCSKTDIFLQNASVKNNQAFAHSGVRSSSMCSLYFENSLCNDMPRFASHPQLNSQRESKRSVLTRSLSSITLRHRSRAYDHIESKVKHYIKQLKREKVVANEHQEESVVNVPHPKEDSVVIQLQKEVEKLQNYLEERDLLLREVQSNYHLLLLQYGEAKNKLDQLRFTSVTPEQTVKSVQVQSHLKPYHEIALVGPYKADQLSVVQKFVHESENQISCSNKGALSVIEDEKGPRENNEECQNTELSDIDNCKSDFEAKGSNELSVEKSTSYSPDMTAQKISSWFSSLPWQLQPVPSCYGSLGSSGSISNQQLDRAPTDRVDENEDEKWVETSQQLWMKNCNLRGSPLGDHSVTVGEGENLCFPPMEKCYCWAPSNIQDCSILEGKFPVELAKAETNDVPQEVLCVPPLDLERLNNSTLPQDSVSKNLFRSEDSLSSGSSQHSSFDEKCSFKQTRVTNQMYLETPTSYKSIVINPGRAEEAKADDKSSVMVCLCRDQQNCRKDEHYLKSRNIQSNRMEGNWEKMNDQRSCCLKKIMQRCCVDDIHICCHWTKTPNHQLFRCEQCVSRNSVLPSDSQILHNLEQCLGNMSVCAEGLRKRSQAIESFLTNLLDSHWHS